MRSSAFLTVCVGALLASLAAPGTSWAQGKKYRVTIESSPPGATIWIDDRAGEPVGETPYSTRLSAGEHTIFLELEGYDVSAEEVTVKRRRRGKQSFQFELTEQSMGSIDVLAADDAEYTEGARVYLDGDEVGTVPDSFDASAGSHQVEVVKDGYKRFQSRIDVSAGDSVELTVALEKLGVKPKGGGKGGSKGGSKGKNVEPAGPILRADVGFGSGIRMFDYSNPNGSNLRTDNLLTYFAPGIALANLSLELYFGGFTPALKRFSLFGGASLSLLANSVTEQDVDIATTWLRREVGLRTRLGPIGIDLAEGGNAFTFDPNDVQLGGVGDGIAESTYEYLRLGLWFTAGSDKMNFGLGASGMYILAMSGVADRFVEPSIIGFGGNAWFRMHLFAGIEGSITGTATYFAYTLVPRPNLDADGGYDLMLDLIGSAGYRF